MKDTARRVLTLALALTPGIGGKTVTRILTRGDLMGVCPTEFLSLSEEALREEYKLTPKIARLWVETRATRIEEAEGLQKRLDVEGVRIITLADATYPRRVEMMLDDPPGVLFVHGNLRLLDARTFGVFSSRGAGERALLQTEHLVEEGALQGEVLVSGHNTPEYQRAAVVPLRWGAPRILVLDMGMRAALGEDLKEEPFRLARLWRYQFDPGTDLVVSTQPPDRAYHRNSNRIRDRLAAGICARLDFAHLSAGGNMHQIALSALRAGRPIRVGEESPLAEVLAASGARVILAPP
jgi:DNA processing protein